MEIIGGELLEKAGSCFQPVRGPGQERQRPGRLLVSAPGSQALGQFRMVGQFDDDEPFPDNVRTDPRCRAGALGIQRGYPRADDG